MNSVWLYFFINNSLSCLMKTNLDHALLFLFLVPHHGTVKCVISLIWLMIFCTRCHNLPKHGHKKYENAKNYIFVNYYPYHATYSFPCVCTLQAHQT